MRHENFSVVTLTADYEGPLAPFAFLLPVPKDVLASRVKTVKRGLFARLDEVTAPRFHAFYEQDPCESGKAEQLWEEKLRPRDRGFLTPEWVPPPDRHYAISNEIGIPMTPVFKGAESEFRYRELEPPGTEDLSAMLSESGYRLPPAALSRLLPYVGRGKRLLLAEVSLEHAELAGKDRLDLGGIRWVTKESVSMLPSTLGLVNANGAQDLFVYVLDSRGRYQVSNYENRFLPSNLEIEPRARERLGSVYNALFDAAGEKSREAFFTEFAWSTQGCGEPCADAPLTPDELLTLGGDELEARTSPKERAPEPTPEPLTAQKEFEARLAERPAADRPRVRREHERDLRELARRRALMARQTYVLTRLHRRYDRSALPRDVELERAPSAMRAGVGIPKGPAHDLLRTPSPSDKDEVQVRFTAFHAWTREMPCAKTFRYRWGKRWLSEARADNAVFLATDLSRKSRERELLLGALRVPVPELGFEPIDPARVQGKTSAPTPSASAVVTKSKGDRGCALGPRAKGPGANFPLFAALALSCLMRGVSRRARRLSFLKRRGPVE